MVSGVRMTGYCQLWFKKLAVGLEAHHDGVAVMVIG